MRQIDLSDGVEIKNYREWLLRLATCGSMFGFVLRDGFKCLLCDSLLERLKPFHFSTHTSNEWPGTVLLPLGNGKTATIYKFSFNRQTIAIILEFAPSLWDWLQPMLPEDFVVYRDQSSPLFVTITHEDAAYFLCKDDEVSTVTEMLNEFGISWRFHAS